MKRTLITSLLTPLIFLAGCGLPDQEPDTTGTRQGEISIDRSTLSGTLYRVTESALGGGEGVFFTSGSTRYLVLGDGAAATAILEKVRFPNDKYLATLTGSVDSGYEGAIFRARTIALTGQP